MLEWFKLTKTIGIYIPIIFLFSFSAFALDNCKGILPVEDSPCLLLLPVTLGTNCTTYNVTVYKENVSLYNSIMSPYSPVLCNATFNQTISGTYNAQYSSGDTMQIIVTQGYTRFYVYICLFIMIIFFIIAGYIFEQDIMLYLVGFMSPVMALDIYNNGFPNVSNVFLTNSITIILTGLGFYYLVVPLLIFLEEKVK